MFLHMFPLRRGRKRPFCIQIALHFPGTCDTYFPLITLVQHLMHVKNTTFFEHAFLESLCRHARKAGLFFPYFRYNFVCSQLRRRGLNILFSISPPHMFAGLYMQKCKHSTIENEIDNFFLLRASVGNRREEPASQADRRGGFFIHSKIQTVFEFQNKIVFVQRPAELTCVDETMHYRE